jgi:hypothetical protein
VALRRPLLSVDQAKRRAAGSLAHTETGDAETNAQRFVADDIGAEAENASRSGGPTSPTIDVAYQKPPVPAAPKPHPVREPVHTSSVTITRIQVFVSAVLPLPHVSRVFDQLCREYPPSKSLQMILRRAMDDYERLLATGGHKNRPTDYPAVDDLSPQSIVQTSRMIREDLLLIARSQFDLLGLESARTFGRKLATAALATFFQSE